ncbi:cytochrome b5 domain-containing protein [Monocercomonoides exilis]|uniref:cytochrome b5 domain-containing protein n=1 Tax=Monocercomonoides exilis TaxID=2049356 RepID=UPI00355955DE|nr:cytochrome b5 domain-containing protein [Monocercomonoides exilis]|eukprot:MONOS_3528.1-p1 / transcript=MONOS_3528.1 / gene=MONOS_3528 / organism=Monocercomonoides_exilis_PA203 / gene_product=cytochrome b5 domain-containing protein / transcript_product=cytochrome b5 domain-containing protein / location=Mono_scaffold00083:108788-109865(-) / protein_length=235 / sequence_SO=supercontig / SO=protein_coding / is_pseudo=false
METQSRFILPTYESDETVASLPRYFTQSDIAQHNSASDCWVSYLGKVLNLTSLIEKHKDSPADIAPFIEAAGTDISHWFKPKSGEFRTMDDPQSGLQKPYTPSGEVLHVLPPVPRTDLKIDFEEPWYKDPQFQVGFVTKKSRKIRLKNMLTKDEHVLEVCCEETLGQIRARYLARNAHAHSYTWKHLRRVLDMTKTLDENGILDEDEEYARLGMDRDDFIPTLHLYFNDDLTEA